MLEVIGKQAKDASRKLAVLGSVRKNEGLRAAAEALLEGEELILAANLKDIRKAEQYTDSGKTGQKKKECR